MNRQSCASLALAISCSFLGSCALPGAGVVQVAIVDSGSVAELTLSQVLEVKLPSNPTTGYSWTVVSQGEPGLQIQIPSKFQQEGNFNHIGAGGTETFTFTPVTPGSGVILMIYHRPFEPEVQPVDTFEIEVTVRE